MKDQTLDIPIYDIKVRIASFESEDEFEDAIREAGYMENIDGATAIALRHPGHNYFQMLFIEQYVSAGAVAHEALHVTNRMLRHLGIEYDTDNDEAMCYLHAFIVDGAHKILL